jgi:RNA polymerase sigma factor (sigma-70 family)
VKDEGADMATVLRQVLDHIQQAGGGPSDGLLLGRFVGTRDEAAFAALVRRHGPMVLGVCRRVLGDAHHAEDAFQATFLVLARKAGSVVRRDSLGCWLYQVAYHTALEAGAANARRRAWERPMKDMPHPEVAAAEAQDWRPLLDRELSRLPEKYRAAIVLCDLEGRTRKEAARLLGVPEGTLSSRLAAGRQLLAKRLAACGVVLSGGALAVALGPGSASAQVSAGLVNLTAKTAALVAAGQAAALSAPAVVLMKGVMRAMLLKKLRLGVGAVLVLAALGMVGLGYRAGSGSGAAQAAPPERSRDELEALRKENDLLRLNLLVVLEKVRAQEGEIRDLRARPAGGKMSGMPGGGMMGMMGMPGGGMMGAGNGIMGMPGGGLGGMPGGGLGGLPGGPPMGGSLGGGTGPPPPPRVESDPVKDAEAAVKALREAKDKEGQRKAAEALDKAMKKLREQLK